MVMFSPGLSTWTRLAAVTKFVPGRLMIPRLKLPVGIVMSALVRMICPSCRRPVPMAPETLQEAGLDLATWKDMTFYEGAGCMECSGTGFRGRTAIHELLDLSDNIREMIVERRPGSEVRRSAEAEGLTSLRESALKKVFSGISTLHEINRVTFVEEVNLTGRP